MLPTSKCRTMRLGARVLVSACALAAGLVACEEPPKPEPIRPVRALRVGDPTTITGRWFPGRAAATHFVDFLHGAD